MVTEFFIKWGLGILTGTLGTIGVFFRKQIIDFFKYKERKKKKLLLKGVNQEIDVLEDRVHQHEIDVEAEIQKHDRAYISMLKEFREEFMSILAPMREAMLSSHYEALLAKCKKYIQAGQITFDELNLLEKDYETYSKLGGNGHMEAWMIRVRQLKIV